MIGLLVIVISGVQLMNYYLEQIQPSTTISSVTPLGAGVSEIYDIMLTVTNDVGCWEEEIGEIEVYEVVADFIISDTLLHCSPQDVTLTSLNNDNIESWNWTVDEQEHTQTISDTDPTYVHSFEDQGYSDLDFSYWLYSWMFRYTKKNE